jgi:hypothetical protein
MGAPLGSLECPVHQIFKATDERKRWQLGEACKGCLHQEGCRGPSIESVTTGPDGHQFDVTKVCNTNCRSSIRALFPEMPVEVVQQNGLVAQKDS